MICRRVHVQRVPEYDGGDDEVESHGAFLLRGVWSIMALTPDQWRAARNRIKNGETIPAIAREMNTGRQTVMRVRDQG